MKRLVKLLLWIAGSGVVMAQGIVPTPLHSDPDIIVTTGGVFDYFNHQSASLSSVSFKATSIAGRPTYVTTTMEFTLAKQVSGGITANGFTTKSGFTQVVAHGGIVDLWLNSELGVTKFDFATLGTFDGAVGASIDLGAKLTKNKYHVYLMPFAQEVSIAGRQIKPVFGLQIGTGFTKTVQ